jgi:DNA polymerase-1
MMPAMSTPDTDDRPRRHLLVVDAPSLLHRSHHAKAHTGITDRAGRPA